MGIDGSGLGFARAADAVLIFEPAGRIAVCEFNGGRNGYTELRRRDDLPMYTFSEGCERPRIARVCTVAP